MTVYTLIIQILGQVAPRKMCQNKEKVRHSFKEITSLKTFCTEDGWSLLSSEHIELTIDITEGRAWSDGQTDGRTRLHAWGPPTLHNISK